MARAGRGSETKLYKPYTREWWLGGAGSQGSFTQRREAAKQAPEVDEVVATSKVSRLHPRGFRASIVCDESKSQDAGMARVAAILTGEILYVSNNRFGWGAPSNAL